MEGTNTVTLIDVETLVNIGIYIGVHMGIPITVKDIVKGVIKGAGKGVGKEIVDVVKEKNKNLKIEKELAERLKEFLKNHEKGLRDLKLITGEISNPTIEPGKRFGELLKENQKLILTCVREPSKRKSARDDLIDEIREEFEGNFTKLIDELITTYCEFFIGKKTELAALYNALIKKLDEIQKNSDENTDMIIKEINENIDALREEMMILSSLTEAPDNAVIIENINERSRSFFDVCMETYVIKINKKFPKPTLKHRNTEGKEEDVTLIDVLADNRLKNHLILLFGEGGSGKSYALFECWKKLLEDERFLPLYIPLKELNAEGGILTYAWGSRCFPPDWTRDVSQLKQKIYETFDNSDVELVLLLDGYNEFAMKTKPEAIQMEIQEFNRASNIRVIFSSRSEKDFKNFVARVHTVTVKRLDKGIVLKYLKSHKTVRELAQDLTISDKLIELLQNPLMLSLFTKVYSSEDKGEGIAEIDRYSNILTQAMKFHKEIFDEVGNTMANYTIDMLLPFISHNEEMKPHEKYEIVELSDKILQVLNKTLEAEYKGFWLRGDYARSEINALKNEDEYSLFEKLIKEIVLREKLFLRSDTQSISWQHEIFMAWFIATGIILELQYQKQSAINKIEIMIKEIKEGSSRSDGFLPIARFLVELIEEAKSEPWAKGFSENRIFLELYIQLAKLYDDVKDSVNIYKFAIPALEKIEVAIESNNQEWESWELAKEMNHVAYALLSIKQEDMDESIKQEDMDEKFDLLACTDVAKHYLDKALRIIQETAQNNIPLFKKQRENVMIAEAQIHGNLGAYCLKMHTIHKDKNWVYEAMKCHRAGLEIREEVFENNPDHLKKNELLGYSYNCLATDCWYLGEYSKSLEYHEKAIYHRESCKNEDFRDKMQLVESYIRCIGAINKIIYLDNPNMLKYLKESIDLYDKALEYERCFLKNRSELKAIKDRFEFIINFIQKNHNSINNVIDNEFICRLNSIATKIDNICNEAMLESNLKSLVSQIP